MKGALLDVLGSEPCATVVHATAVCVDRHRAYVGATVVSLTLGTDALLYSRNYLCGPGHCYVCTLFELLSRLCVRKVAACQLYYVVKVWCVCVVCVFSYVVRFLRCDEVIFAPLRVPLHVCVVFTLYYML